MNDYKELIYALKSCQHIASNCIDCPLSNTKYYNPKTKECEVHLDNVAADVIAQLNKERNAAAADISKLIIYGNACKICKHDFSDDPIFCLECDELCPHGNFCWRGVREVDND